MTYRLLDKFRATFEGVKYLHRDSSLGDKVAVEFYEDLYAVNRSVKLVDRIEAKTRVLNVQNRRRGIQARRGDGTFGELIPNVEPITDPGFTVARGPVATIEIGIEAKILAKAMIKQIDRVIGNLTDQVQHFRRGGGDPISIAIVGLNYADHCTSYEGDREYPTNGRNFRHPYQEADEAERRLLEHAAPKFEEFLILRYKATNEGSFPFSWVNAESTGLDYGAIVTRISREYDRRF